MTGSQNLSTLRHSLLALDPGSQDRQRMLTVTGQAEMLASQDGGATWCRVARP